MNDLMTVSADREDKITMNSLEIAELTGKRHDNVMTDIRSMLEELELNAPDFSGAQTYNNNNTRTVYSLDKELTLTLVSGYSVKMRHAIIKRWQELESRKPLDAERIASELIARGILPGMIGWWQEQLNGGYHGENNWNITPKSSVSELQYSFRNYCQRHDLYGIPTGRGYGYFFNTNQFKISLKEVSGVWSTKELKFHGVEDLKSRFESKRVDLCMLCV